MKKIWKMQCRKIFYSVDYVGFLVVGSVLVILFGWTYVMAGNASSFHWYVQCEYC